MNINSITNNTILIIICVSTSALPRSDLSKMILGSSH